MQFLADICCTDTIIQANTHASRIKNPRISGHCAADTFQSYDGWKPDDDWKPGDEQQGEAQNPEDEWNQDDKWKPHDAGDDDDDDELTGFRRTLLCIQRCNSNCKTWRYIIKNCREK